MNFDKRIGMMGATLLAVAAPLVAQGTCPSGEPRYGSIGVREYRCIGGSCSINMRLLIDGEIQKTGDLYVHSFSTEPRLQRIDPDGPGADLLREGDVLVAVDDRLITTAEGGRRLGSLEPGEDIKLTLRRDGRLINAWIETTASCDLPMLDVRTDATGHGFQYSSIYAVSDSIAWAAPTVFSPPDVAAWNVLLDTTGVWSRGPLTFSDSTGFHTLGTYPAWGSTPGYAYRVRPGLPGHFGDARPSVEFGLELSCEGCGWRTTGSGRSFETDVFPVIESVEKGGPADQAGLLPGDILIGVSGAPITSPEAASTLGGLVAGETVTFEIRRADRFLELSIAPREATGRRQRM